MVTNSKILTTKADTIMYWLPTQIHLLNKKMRRNLKVKKKKKTSLNW